MAHEVIEIDSDSDLEVKAKAKGKGKAAAATTTATVLVGDGSDIVWDTLDDGWVDRIMREGRESANAGIVDLSLSPRPLPIPAPLQTQPQTRPCPTQSSQIDTFTSPAKIPTTRPIVLEIADSPVSTRPAAAPIRPNGLLAPGRHARAGKGEFSDSGSDSDDLALSLDFLVAPRVDKGKRRAMDDGGSTSAVGRTLKRSRTTNDEFSSPPLPTRPLGTSRSLSLLPESTTARTISPAGITAAEKRAAESARAKAIKAVEAERIKADKAREKERAVQDKERKKRDQEVNKLRNSKSDTVKEVTVHISAELSIAPSPIAPSIPLLRDRLAEKQSSLTLVPVPTDEAPARYDPVDGETTHVPGLITVKRFVQAEFDAAKRRFVALPQGHEYWQDQLPYVLVVTAKELVGKIIAGRTDKSRGLIAWLTTVKRKLGLTRSATATAGPTAMGAAPTTTPGGAQTNACEIMLLIHGLKAFHAKAASVKRKEFSERARNHMAGQGAAGHDGDVDPLGGGMPGKEEVDKELVRLQLVHRCFQVCVDNKIDTMEWLYNIAGDIAIRPYRHIQNSHLPFSTRDMPKKGDGPFNTFKLMLEEVTGVTESGAEGIAAQWKSFRTLMEGFERLERRKARGEIGQKEVEGMLANCVVKALTTGVANARPLGMAVSKHVYRAFRGKDPESIDS